MLAALALLWVAAGSAGAAAPPDHPDGRVYEKVSPDAKNGFDAIGWSVARSSSPSGDKLVFGTLASAPGAASGAFTPLLGVRDGVRGWSSKLIDAPMPPGSQLLQLYQSVADDLTQGVSRSFAKLTPDATESSPQLYLHNLSDADGSSVLLTPRALPPSHLAPEPGVSYGGATPGFGQVVYNAPLPQTDDAVTGAVNAYERIGGLVRLVGVLPDPDGPGGAPAPVPSHGSVVGAGTISIDNAISRDGARIFFHAIEASIAATPQSSRAGQLYVRESGTRTLHVSASQRSTPDPSGPLPALYWTAEAEHGSTVLFTSCEKLTDDSAASAADSPDTCTSGSLPGHHDFSGFDLYLYDVETGDLFDLTTGDPGGGDVLGVVGASDDLERVYFVARGLLAPGATSGEPNLYVSDDGAIDFIATLDETPAAGGKIIDADNWAQAGLGKVRTTRVTPDGRQLLITARAQLTAYDNRNPAACPPIDQGLPGVHNPEGRCSQVYLYDADRPDDGFRCLSCPSSGTAPVGDAALTFSTGGGPAGSVTDDPMPRSLRADGRRAFFESPEKLAVPGDANGRMDVYEWHDGEVNLISPGSGDSDAQFLDATPSGDSVFFLSRERILRSDVDELDDVYVARVNGRDFESASPEPPCAGDECQGPRTAAPRLPEAATARFFGPVLPSDQSRPSFSVRGLTKAQRRRLVRGRSVALRVRVNQPGRVSFVARARRGARQAIVARGAKRARRAGTVRLVLRLGRHARQRIANGRLLRVTVTVRLAGVPEPQTLSARLSRSPHAGAPPARGRSRPTAGQPG